MKKIYLTLLSLMILVPCALKAQTYANTAVSVVDTAYNSDNTPAYRIEASTVAQDGKSTLTLTFSPLTSDLEEIYDIDISRDTDARLKDRVRIAKGVSVPSSTGTVIFEDNYETWTYDGGGDYQYTGSGSYPTGTPLYYSITINRLDEYGGTARTKRSYPALYFPEDPDNTVVDAVSGDMTLVTNVYPNSTESSVTLRLHWAPDYTVFQKTLMTALSGEPLYPAGDKPVYYANVYVNSTSSTEGRTNISYGNLYWGYEGPAYAKIDIPSEYIGADGYTYIWLTGGRPGYDTSVPIPVNIGITNGIEDENSVDFRTYPNPASDIVYLECEDMIETVSLINLAGKEVYSKVVNSNNKVSINISEQPDGIYFIVVETGSKVITNKIIKK